MREAVRASLRAPRRLWRRAVYTRQLRRLAGPKLLDAFAREYPTAFFVEIGANDGDHHDHLRHFILEGEWSGIMVEPVPYVFQRLERNYAGVSRVTPANVAVAERDGDLPFYHLDEPAAADSAALPDWYDGLGSFSREAVLAHARDIPDIASRIRERLVPALTFSSLCARYRVENVDLIVLDTEGYDFRIIKSIDLDSVRPRLLIYEHFHLSPEDRRACRAHLASAGYETMEEGFDTFCLDASIDDALTARWRKLKPAVRGVSVHDQA